MHKKIIMACMAIAAFAAFVAPSASAVNLTENGTTLNVGASFRATNVGNTLFTAGNLTVTCTTAQLAGTLNTDVNGTIQASLTKNPTFDGTGSGGDCTSGLGDVKATVTSSLCLYIPSGTDTGEVSGCGALLDFSLDVTGVVTCKYFAASVSGTISTSGDATVTISEAPATEEGGKFLCPDTGKFDMKFILTTTEGTTLTFS